MRERDLIRILLGTGGEGETCGIVQGAGSKKKIYLLHEFLNLIPEGIFPLRRDGEVEFLLGDGFDVVVQVNKVRGGLKFDFAMVGVHCFVLLLTYYG